MKFKCRPAEECYHDDPYYTREIEPPDYDPTPRRAAAMFCEQRCSERSEYEEFDVQVLTPAGWLTFEITLASVPEFHATPKKGVPPAPPTFLCNGCDKRKPSTEETHDGSWLCKECHAEELRLDAEEDAEEDAAV